MKLSVRVRLTLFFSILFGCLVVVSMGLLYSRVSSSFHHDFYAEMVHDGRIIAELFKEELRLNALQEFEHEIKEFGIELQVLDEGGRVVVESAGWKSTGVRLEESQRIVRDAPLYQEIKVGRRTFALFSRPVHIPFRGHYSLHIVRSQDPLHRILGTFVQWIFIVGPFAVLLSAIAGYLFSGRTLEAEERAFDRLKKFTADASHELRIPLTALRGNLEVALRKERLVGEYKETIQKALEEAEHLSELTQDLLLLSQTDAGQIALRREKVALKDFLLDVYSQAQGLAASNQIRLSLNPLGDGEVMLDSERIRQLLLNLIDNAVTYNRPSGEVRMGGKIVDRNVRFTVEDTGIGIGKKDLEKIFDRFYRVDKSRSRELGGAGLGLSIVRWIAEAHGGDVEVKSEVGKGTVFTVTIPA